MSIEQIGNNNHLNTINDKNQTISTIEQTKNKLISILINSNYINETNASKLHTIENVANYMKSLVKDEIITEERYIQICIEAGAIKLGKYLVYKGLISNNDLEYILKEQKKLYKDKMLGEVLLEKKLLKNKDLIKALEEFGVIRLGEYLILKGIINELQLNIFLKTQKHKNIPLGKILIDFNILTQKELNEILENLGIKLDYSDFISDEDEELDYYKIKED